MYFFTFLCKCAYKKQRRLRENVFQYQLRCELLSKKIKVRGIIFIFCSVFFSRVCLGVKKIIFTNILFGRFVCEFNAHKVIIYHNIIFFYYCKLLQLYLAKKLFLVNFTLRFPCFFVEMYGIVWFFRRWPLYKIMLRYTLSIAFVSLFFIKEG